MDVPLTRDVDGYGRPCSLRGHDLPSTSSPRNRRPDTNAPNNETTFIRILCSIHRRHILYILEEKKKEGAHARDTGTCRFERTEAFHMIASVLRVGDPFIHQRAIHTERKKKRPGTSCPA